MAHSLPPFPPDIEAEITFVPTDQGGRHQMAQSGGYAPQFYYDGHDWDARYGFHEKEWVSPGETVHASIWFLSPQCHLGRVHAGMEFQIREGSRVVGSGHITRILNLAESAERIGKLSSE